MTLRAGDRVMLDLGPSFHYHGTIGFIKCIGREGKDIFVKWDGDERLSHILCHHWLTPIGPDHPSMTMTEAGNRHMEEWRKRHSESDDSPPKERI